MSDSEFFKPIPSIIAVCAALMAFVGSQSVVVGIVVLAIVYRVISHLSKEIEKTRTPAPAPTVTAAASSPAAAPVPRPVTPAPSSIVLPADADDKSLQRKLKALQKDADREAKASNTRKNDSSNRANTRARRDSQRKKTTAAAKAERRAETTARNERLDAGSTQKKKPRSKATTAPQRVADSVDPNVLWLEQLKQLDAKIISGELTDEAYEQEYDRIMVQRDADLEKFGILSIDAA